MISYPPCRKLTRSEQHDLAARIKAGDREARETMIMANLSLVTSIAKHYHSSGATPDDLIQEGNRGLIYAVDRYDPETYNACFSTYATYWIRNMMQRAVIANCSLIRVPEYAYLRNSRSCKLGGESTISHSSDLGIDDNGDEATLENTIPDREPTYRDPEIAEKLAEMNLALDQLTPLERWTISRRFGLGDKPEKSLSYRQIAKMADMSFSAVQRIGDSALRKLRKRLRHSCACA